MRIGRLTVNAVFRSLYLRITVISNYILLFWWNWVYLYLTCISQIKRVQIHWNVHHCSSFESPGYVKIYTLLYIMRRPNAFRWTNIKCRINKSLILALGRLLFFNNNRYSLKPLKYSFLLNTFAPFCTKIE